MLPLPDSADYIPYDAPGDPIGFAPDFAETPEPYGEPDQRILSTIGAEPSVKRVLDVAGGYGRYAIPLLNIGLDVELLDIHWASLVEARRRAELCVTPHTRLNTWHCDVLRSSFPALRGVDAALSVGFVHHLTEDAAVHVIGQTVKCLKSFGLILIEFATEKYRRRPDGTPIRVNGDNEQNMRYEDGIMLLRKAFEVAGCVDLCLNMAPIRIRQGDFWYDSIDIIASARRGPALAESL